MSDELEAGIVDRAPTSRTDFHRPVHCLLGLPIDVVTLAEAVSTIERCADNRTRCFFSTPNLDFVITAHSDPVFRDSIMRSDFALADGMPLVWIARLLRIPMRERVSGASIFEALRKAPGRPLSVYLFGGPDGVAQKAAAALDASADRMTCVGFQSPGFGTIEEMSAPQMLRAINDARPDFVVVALGARKGQTWIEHNLARLDAPVVSHLGAVVNFVAGTIRRAPPVWQRLGMEWLWRIYQEPHLWRRYAADGIGFARLFVAQVLPALINVRFRWPREAALARAKITSTRAADGRWSIVMSGHWTHQNSGALRDALARSTSQPADIRIDLDAVEFLDSACIGLLLLLRGHQSKCGADLDVVAVEGGTAAQMLHNNGAAFLLGDHQAKKRARA